MNITTGIIPSAKKVVIYGPEGIGKSSFAALFPNPLFTDTEGSTKELNISRFDKPTSWAMLLEQGKYVRDYKPCKTYVIDTADWAEKLDNENICARAGKSGIEDFGYGKGYVYAKEEFGKYLNLLDEIIAVGINVVFTAHSFLRKVEQPDEMGAYDRYELKTSKHIAPLIKEWCDMLLFVNYKTEVFKDENGKAKARGNKRVMYTTHSACWDAKNRYGFPDELPFEYKQIGYIFEEEQSSQAQPNKTESVQKEEISTTQNDDDKFNQFAIVDNTPEDDYDFDYNREETIPYPSDSDEPSVQKLFELMREKEMSIEVLQATVADAGYFPRETPIENYGKDFIEGCLIGAWEQVCDKAKKYMVEPF